MFEIFLHFSNLFRRFVEEIVINGRGYKIVAEYEAILYRTTQSYIRATTLQICTTNAMFYSLCYNQCFL